MANYLGIDTEARQNVRQPIGIDHMRDRYRTSSEIYTFPSPTLETIEKNMFFLLKNSEYKQFELKYNYRPDYLSFDEYGTVLLDKLLMFVNGVFTVEEFLLDKVVVPSHQAVVAICQDKFPLDRDVDELTEVAW